MTLTLGPSGKRSARRCGIGPVGVRITGWNRIIGASSNATIRCAASGSFAGAARFCNAHDELRDHFRCRQHLNETVPLSEQRRLFREC